MSPKVAGACRSPAGVSGGGPLSQAVPGSDWPPARAEASERRRGRNLSKCSIV